MMSGYVPYMIKSFKHDGHLHRMWKENWLLGGELLTPEHREAGLFILINDHTPIQEANGNEWVSRIPGVSFFVPGSWFNVVALMEASGIRYYCNIASPPYSDGRCMTYIDYDLDVVVSHDKQVHIVDEEEYEHHKLKYHYSPLVQKKVQAGLNRLLERIELRQAPFHDDTVRAYYSAWRAWRNRGLE
ncbi:DUF402 domain-containing protein [Marinicrinis sediminis]|uniref:DUF402 domain-containing protein n=1 Tax=Marinicrinis sediminis TaxID=1652465 RepID=A0ABW5RET2_9BACL